jgi:serine protease AprX
MKMLKTNFQPCTRETLRIKKIILILFVCFSLMVMTGLAAWGGEMGRQLQAVLPSLRQQEEVSIIVTLSDKVDLSPFQIVRRENKSARRLRIVNALKDKAELTQGPLRSLLGNRGARNIKHLWIINGLSATVPASLINEIAAQPGVETVQLDSIIRAPVPAVAAPTTVPEWNLSLIRAPELWNLGHTGTGVVVANMDTGVDINHPDLQGRWRGGANSWFNPYSYPANASNCGIPNQCSPCELSSNTPCDTEGHGTQTMGVLVGGSAGETAIGVAPGSQWIAVKIYNDRDQSKSSIIHQAFQWLLNPDGDAGTQDGPDVVNGSWDLDLINGCDLQFQPDIQALKAAGIAVAFSAGNYGPNLSTSVSPANIPDSFAVGAVDQSQTIAPFSSRGPSACDGATYPDLVAPGVNINTSDLTFGGVLPDSYAYVSGTSYSAPHVAGAMALLLSAFPDLAVSEIELALAQSAFDLGLCGADNDYGYGLLDVMKAYQLLLNPAPDVSACPLSNQFGTTKEGSLSSPQLFTVTNKGITDLVIGVVSMTGQHANDFTVQSDGCSFATVAPDGSCTVQVAFSPTSGGAKAADLSIPSNDPDQNPFLVPLSGTAIEQYSLTVIKSGSGSGKVTGARAAIDCGTDCSGLYAPKAGVTLKALRDAESAFGGWSGCTWIFGTTCHVTMNADKTVTATFEGPSLTLTTPSGGEVWKAGTFKKITWSYTGRPGVSLRIELLKGGSLYSTIANQARIGFHKKGAHYWRIPKDFPTGNDYEIKVTSTSNNSYTDTSDSTFTISQ